MLPWFRSGHPVESRSHANSTVPRPGAICEGGRLHSPGAALPLLVWLSLRLAHRKHIFGKSKPNLK